MDGFVGSLINIKFVFLYLEFEQFITLTLLQRGEIDPKLTHTHKRLKTYGVQLLLLFQFDSFFFVSLVLTNLSW